MEAEERVLNHVFGARPVAYEQKCHPQHWRACSRNRAGTASLASGRTADLSGRMAKPRGRRWDSGTVSQRGRRGRAAERQPRARPGFFSTYFLDPGRAHLLMPGRELSGDVISQVPVVYE